MTAALPQEEKSRPFVKAGLQFPKQYEALEAQEIAALENVRLPSPPPVYNRLTANATTPDEAAVPQTPQNYAGHPAYKDGPFFFNPLKESTAPTAIPRWNQQETIDGDPMLPYRVDRRRPNPNDETYPNVDCRLSRILGFESRKFEDVSPHHAFTKNVNKGSISELGDPELDELVKEIESARTDFNSKYGLAVTSHTASSDARMFSIHSPGLAWWPASDTWAASVRNGSRELPHLASFGNLGTAASKY